MGLENKFAHREALYQAEKTQIFLKNSGIPAFNASDAAESRLRHQLQGSSPHDLLAENRNTDRKDRVNSACPLLRSAMGNAEITALPDQPLRYPVNHSIQVIFTRAFYFAFPEYACPPVHPVKL